ncbi:hypothetical protein CEUSTIGMA_g4919.t1 [Chlamydomonas eustigma]|uniref:Uncharacterized protein n=1 Tax=Chlamydomonas eustigma TaxID=1157962 RepID=A0A250X339_9CHLO|nr:hypothetical protein CEUSTIGMA_g4919.t1 [Chlamydomonas eustigma]|eukprot:GAX77475.1 hypothetical protein CEUSTIGMA_g4919.t1 [Chlamydomonas eustigma]
MPKHSKISIWKAWAKAEPWQRRNLVISGLMIFWAGALYMDMANLKTDPKFKEKFKVEEASQSAPAGPSAVAIFYSRMMETVRPKDGDW